MLGTKRVQEQKDKLSVEKSFLYIYCYWIGYSLKTLTLKRVFLEVLLKSYINMFPRVHSSQINRFHHIIKHPILANLLMAWNSVRQTF